MAFDYEATGYVDVAARIKQLREKHPEAVLRPANPDEPFKIMEIGGREFIVYTAACYRTPDDPTPAIAVAAEPAVGRTPYTKDSEVMNAETSAWGRAIVAALACDTHKIASADEVRNRMPSNEDQSWRDKPAVTPKKAKVGSAASTGKISEAQKKLVETLAAERLPASQTIQEVVGDMFGEQHLDNITTSQASALIKSLMGMEK